MRYEDHYNKPEYRYKHDVEFRNLVDSMYQHIERAKFTPSEMRQAAVLASIHYEQRHSRPMRVGPVERYE